MNKRLLVTLSVLIAVFVGLAHAQRDDDDDDDRPVVRPHALKPGEKPLDADFACPYSKTYQRPQKLPGFTLAMSAHLRTPAARCRAILNSSKSHTTVAEDWALNVDKISGSDVNGDGKADLVIDGYSGGDHCCFTYSIVALSEPPRVLRKIQSRSPLSFNKQSDGSVIIHGADTSFDYFIIPHFAAVIPQVFLRVEGDRLVNAGSQFQDQYDQQIAEARSQLTQADLDKFRQSSYHQKMFTDQIPTVHRVLTMVLDYLYSGRETQAWQTIDDLWPVSDRSRIKDLILERRRRGVMSQLNSGEEKVTAAEKAQ